MPDLIPIPWPKRGIDQSLPAAEQPPLTCWDARNARTLSANGQVLGGGRRKGLAKAITAQVTGGKRLRHIHAIRRIPNTTAPDYTGTAVPQVDTPGMFTGVQPKVNLLGRFIRYHRDPATARLTDAADLTNISSYYGYPVLAITNTGAALDTVLAVPYPTTNNVSVTLTAYLQVTVASNYTRATHCGPYVRGSDGDDAVLQTGFVAYLERVADNQVRLAIDEIQAATLVRRATSATTFNLAGTVSLAQGLRITLKDSGTVLTATVEWPLGGITLDSVTYASATYATQKGGGVYFIRVAGYAQKSRTIEKIEYTRVEPYAWPVVGELLGTTTISGTHQYRLPAGWSGSTRATGAPPSSAGNNDGPIDTAAATAYPSVDTTNTFITATTNNALGTAHYLVSMTGRDPANAGSGGQQWAVELSFRSIASGSDAGSALFDADLYANQGVYVYLERAVTQQSVDTGQIHFSKVTLRVRYTDNAGNVADGQMATFNLAATRSQFSFHQSARIRCVHTVSGGTRTITLSCNGVTFFSQAYQGTATWITASTGPAVPPAGTYYGMDVTGDGAATSVAGLRILDMTQPAFTAIQPGTDLVAMTDDGVFIAQLTAAASWAQCGTDAMTGSVPQSAFLFNKVYAVDGVRSVLIDPIAKTLGVWTSVSNTALDKCSLCCAYRGRAVIGKQQSKPGIWYMSRIGVPTDFDFGAADTAAKAYSGDNADVGQPGDELTALIPHGDDYMIFGCIKSLWALQGDPGSGGRVQLVAGGGGVVGPRAWCITGTGDLYYLSPVGLCRLRRGSLTVEPIAIGRLPGILDNADLSMTLTQLRYDPATRCVHVLLTPPGGGFPPAPLFGIGVHAVYDTTLEEVTGLGGGLWLDNYGAVALQPWSADTEVIDGAGEPQVLVGCDDGYVRKFSPTANTDDGTAIDSYVKLAPVMVGGGSTEAIATELQATLLPASGPVSWGWRTGASAGVVNNLSVNTFDAGGRLSATGRQPNVGLRTAGIVHQLALFSIFGDTGNGWAVESLAAAIQPTARSRVL